MLLVENRALLDRFKRGEPGAMATVFEHYSDPISRYLRHGFCYGSGGQRLRFTGVQARHELHDLVAETFRAAFETRARAAYSGLSPFEGYLKTIARNLVIDRLRSKAYRWEPLDESGDAQEASAEPQAAADRLYEQQELKQLMRDFVRDLPESEQDFVRLRYEERLAQQEVAERLRRTRRWVRTVEERLRRRLLIYLDRSGYLPAAARDSGDVRVGSL